MKAQSRSTRRGRAWSRAPIRQRPAGASSPLSKLGNWEPVLFGCAVPQCGWSIVSSFMQVSIYPCHDMEWSTQLQSSHDVVLAEGACKPCRSEGRQAVEAPESSPARLQPSVSFNLIGHKRSMDAPGPGSGPARTAAWVDSATTSREPEAEGEETDQDMLRRVFKAWRTAAANQHARRVHSNQNEVPLHEREQLHSLLTLMGRRSL